DRLLPSKRRERSSNDRDQRRQRPVSSKIFERRCAGSGESEAAQNSQLLDSAAAIGFHENRRAPFFMGYELHPGPGGGTGVSNCRDVPQHAPEGDITMGRAG